jgi:hypothetical protein
LRRTLREAQAAVRAIKPCFLMSPLTVAQYVPGHQPSFDLVVFDEASQLPPEDAVGAIIRGKQLIVVGDPKQLPPTTFFNSYLDPQELYAPDGTPIYEDAESVLEQFMGAGVPKGCLKWHYRSAHGGITRQQITHGPDSVGQSSLHRGRDAERLMHAAQVVERDEQGDGQLEVVELFAEGVR